MTTQLTKTTEIAVNSYTTLNSSFTSSFNVGAVIQGDMRQLAMGRWNYMYPSSN